jgi:predicted nucleotidyltransferase
VFDQDFREFLKSLNDNHVRYLVIGGYAVAYHGHPRYTKDMDVWVASDKENAAQIVKALDDFGFASLGLKEEDFLEPGQIIQLGYPPNRIDLYTSTLGVDFETCYPDHEVFEMDGIQVNFIDLKNPEAQ